MRFLFFRRFFSLIDFCLYKISMVYRIIVFQQWRDTISPPFLSIVLNI